MRKFLLDHEGEFVLLLGGKSVGKTYLMKKLVEEQRDYARAFEEVKKERQGRISELRKQAASHEADAAQMRDSDPMKQETVLAADALRKEALAIEAEMKEEATMHMPRRFITYNARLKSANLVSGIMKAAEQQLGRDFYVRLVGFASAFTEVATTVSTGSKHAGEAAGKVVSPFVPGELSLEALLEGYVAACEKDGVYPCLIIEEANRALATRNENQRSQTLDALSMLTALTKESKRMNVVMAASEHTEPFRLAELGFKSDNITRTVLAPEVLPADMRDLLENKWGMGPNLASAMMAVWGGHVHAACEGLISLQILGPKFTAAANPVVASTIATSGAAFCAQAEGRGTAGMLDMLRRMSERGFAPFSDIHDPRVRMISEANVGGAVYMSTTAHGVPLEFWTEAPDCTSIVVPTSQAMRMLLASKLREQAAIKPDLK